MNVKWNCGGSEGRLVQRKKAVEKATDKKGDEEGRGKRNRDGYRTRTVL